MNRLTTDVPTGNVSYAHNMFFAKDGETWVRNCGPEPECGDIKLTDFIRLAAKTMNVPGLEREIPWNDRALDELMTDMVADWPEEPEGLLAIIHTAGWAFAELREHLKAYEDAAVPIVMPDDLETFREAVKTYGPDAQTDMMIEEMSELTKAFLKLRRIRSHPGPGVAECRDHISEEMADVYIMLVQLLGAYGNAKEVEFYVRQKAARLRRRLHPEAASGT